jgi:hypothetical protein
MNPSDLLKSFGPNEKEVDSCIETARELIRKNSKKNVEVLSSSMSKFPLEISEDQMLLVEALRSASVVMSVITNSFDWGMADVKLYELRVPEKALKVIKELHKEVPSDMKDWPDYNDFESMVLIGMINVACQELRSP